jgi:hypothetical protein
VKLRYEILVTSQELHVWRQGDNLKVLSEKFNADKIGSCITKSSLKHQQQQEQRPTIRQ